MCIYTVHVADTPRCFRDTYTCICLDNPDIFKRNTEDVCIYIHMYISLTRLEIAGAAAAGI